ncbi:MAG: IMPACT family protein [Eubacteriales bacterium]
MEERYVTLGGEGFGRLVERKSEFLAYAAHVTTESEALAFLDSVRKKHSDARHNVYAYMLKAGNLMRYSDDGEPQGTAGMPVLDVIRKSGFTDAILVVTRYFGGILLGTGGLVRAYSAAAKLAVDDAKIVEFIPFDELLFTVDYSLWQKVRVELPKFFVKTDRIEYGADVEVQIALPQTETARFLDRLTEMSAGRAEAIEIGQRYDSIDAGI